MTQIALAVGALFVLLVVGVPIGFALSTIGVVGFAPFASLPAGLNMLAQTTVDAVMNYGFSVLPMFLLMGNVIARSRIAEELYDAAGAFIGHRRGGLAGATVLACGGFGAVCGSSVATAATMARISAPVMMARGYAPSLALGSVAAGGTLGILIPPSVAMVIYGLITETDIGQLFVAGILPGVLGIACYLGAVWVQCWLNPALGPRAPRVPWPARLVALLRLWPVLALFALVMGGIYAGIFTATEAAAIGAAGACLLALIRRDLDARGFIQVFAETGQTTAMLFMVVIGALVLTTFLNVAGLPPFISSVVAGLDAAPLVILLVILLIYLVLGCFLDSMAIMLLTVPIFFPVVTGLGYDPVWFGILVVCVIEVGLISPPFGMNLFVARAVMPQVGIGQIFRGVMPFIGADIVRLAILVAFPAIALLLTGRPW
jgi:tripartite ATP-independent transporter DctM subunit